MNSPRRQSREVALKALYQAEINNYDLLDSLNQVLVNTLFMPAIDIVVREFLKNTKASEILSGEVEDFIPDFVDSISNKVHENESDLRFHIKQILEKYFPGVTINESFQNELQNLLALINKRLKKQIGIESFAKEIVTSISENNKFIEGTIEKTANNWSLSRMATIDKCILKISVSEFFYFPSIPVKATINEAIELAKKYSTDRSYEFVNGILDKVSKENKFIKAPNQSKATE